MMQKYYNFCKCAKVSYPISHIFRIYDSITVRLPCEILNIIVSLQRFSKDMPKIA